MAVSVTRVLMSRGLMTKIGAELIKLGVSAAKYGIWSG